MCDGASVEVIFGLCCEGTIFFATAHLFATALKSTFILAKIKTPSRFFLVGYQKRFHGNSFSLLPKRENVLDTTISVATVIIKRRVLILCITSMHTHPPFREIAKILRAFGNESRIGIVVLLRERSYTLKELGEILNIRPANASKHLHRLINLGLVEGKRKGKEVSFSLTTKVQTSHFFWECIEANTLR